MRDELLGRPVTDRDWVVVGATPQMMVASGYRPVGRDFPVFLHPDSHEEYALARTERKSGTGYRGFAFFASPEVTLEDDLARRDLTINAMARADDGTLVDPHGGQRDLAAGVLRHVSTAFAEDPLRVLRVARFAARFGFRVAPSTRSLMRRLADSGELATLSTERVWTELATGLREATPSRMFAVLRGCGALAALLPEVDAAWGESASPSARMRRILRALDIAAAGGATEPVRYAILAHDLGSLPAETPLGATAARRRADAMSARLKVPLEARDLAGLAARFRYRLDAAVSLTPALWLELIEATDALRRPERLDQLVAVGTAMHAAGKHRDRSYAAQAAAYGALAAVRSVDAAKIAAAVEALPGRARGERIAAELRRARLAALRRWKAANGQASRGRQRSRP